MNEARNKAISNFLTPIHEALVAAGHGGELIGGTIHIPTQKDVTVRVICGFQNTKPCAPLWNHLEILGKPHAVIRDMTYNKTKVKRMKLADSIVAHVTAVREKHLQEK